MQQSLDAMRVALRVLTALNDKRQPEASEIATLRQLAGPNFATTSLDELACEVVQNALKHRVQARGA